MKDAQHKLSKRNGDASFQDLVAKGYLPEAILNYIALLGWNPGTEQEIFSLAELEKVFDANRLNKSPAIFDITKLKWMNGCYIRALPFEKFHQLAEKEYDKFVEGLHNWMLEYTIDDVSAILLQSGFYLESFYQFINGKPRLKLDPSMIQVLVDEGNMKGSPLKSYQREK